MEIKQTEGKFTLEATESEIKDLLTILDSVIATSNYELLDPLDTTVPDHADRDRLRGLREIYFKQIKDYHQKLKRKDEKK